MESGVVDARMDLTDALDFVRTNRNGILITQKSDGRPQSSNIAYLVRQEDGVEKIIISLTNSRAKTTNARRTPQVSLHVNRDDFWAYAVIEADVDLTPVAAAIDDTTVDELVEYYRSLAGEHDDWDEYRAAMVDEGRLLMKLTPTHAYGMLNR